MTKKVIAVLLPLPINQSFLYTVDNDNYIVAGDYVVVPFGHKRLIGIVWQLNIQTTRKLKYIEQKIDLPNITAKLKAFAEWVADYNLIPVGILVKMIMGGVIKISNIDKLVYTNQKQQIKKVNYQLNSEQLVAKNKITTNLNSYSVTLLDGETGSGKTEVYLSVILELIKAESNAQIFVR